MGREQAREKEQGQCLPSVHKGLDSIPEILTKP